MRLDLRTKSTVEEGVQWSEKSKDGGETVCYCPGDGTRYVIIISPISYSEEVIDKIGLSSEWENVIVTIVSNPSRVRSFITHKGAFISYHDVQEKLEMTLSSSITLAEFLGWILEGDAWSCDVVAQNYADQ